MLTWCVLTLALSQAVDEKPATRPALWAFEAGGRAHEITVEGCDQFP